MVADLVAPAPDQPVDDTAPHLLVIDDDMRIRTLLARYLGGCGFRVTSDANHGLYQPYGALYEAGDWRNIRHTLLADSAWQQHWHPVAQSPWLFHPTEGIFVSYEDPRSIEVRSRLAKDAGLRGVFMWELTGDDDQHSLLQAMTKPFE